MQKVLSQESPDFAEEYIDEDLPESSADEEQIPPAKPDKELEDPNHKKTNFTEDRFTKLFQPRNRNQLKPNPFLPKHLERVKPTLPSFIKKSPPIIRVTPSTPSPAQSQRFNQRTTPTTLRTTTRTPPRGSNTNNRRNQVNGNFNINSRGTSTTASPTTTDLSARRRYGSGNRRFNTNSTIPATTSRPRRS